MNIFAIETSCDETSVAMVKDGRTILSNVIASQVEVHARYGGIVHFTESGQAWQEPAAHHWKTSMATTLPMLGQVCICPGWATRATGT